MHNDALERTSHANCSIIFSVGISLPSDWWFLKKKKWCLVCVLDYGDPNTSTVIFDVALSIIMAIWD